MNKPTSILTLGVLSLALSGCISHIGVTKVQPGVDPKGLRYYLPQPVIVGYPQPDGTITYEEKMLPDLEREYAISAWSFMAKHKAKITRTPEMFLNKAELKQDSTAVAKQTLDSSGSVGGAIATRIGEDKKAQREEAKEKQTNVDTKKRAVKAAELQLRFAEEDLAALPLNADPAVRAAAEKAVKEARRAVEKAEQELEFALNAKSFDNPTADDPTAPKPKRGVAAGPVIYRIVENPETGGVSLEPMTFEVATLALKQARSQRRFQTVTPAEKPAEPKKKSDADAPLAVHLTQAQPQTQVPMPAGVKVIVAESSVTRISPEQNASDQFDLTSGPNGIGLTVTRKPGTPAGEYRVKAMGATVSGSKQQVTRNVVVEAQ